MTSIFTAPIYKLEELNNIFIELTAKNCNQRCKNCYLDVPTSTKTVKDFIHIDKIKEASIDELIDAVCSKGGTTIEAVKVFNENNINKITETAVDACVKRSIELEKL